MAKRKSLGKSFKPISPKKARAIAKAMREAREEQERRERQKREIVALIVGKCHCGGNLNYVSAFIFSGSVTEMHIGGDNPTKESCKCACLDCGAMYDPEHLKFRGQIEKFRNR